MEVTNLNEEFGESWTWMTRAWFTIQLLATLLEKPVEITMSNTS